MVMTHVVFVLYWLVKDLRVDPAARLFRDYSSPTLVHWNCLFLPLDLEVAAYAASKAAVGALTKSLTVEWGLRGVCVNAIAPGVFRTNPNTALLGGSERGKELKLRIPMERFRKVEELVGAGVFLASESASFVNGEILAVDGGFLASGFNQRRSSSTRISSSKRKRRGASTTKWPRRFPLSTTTATCGRI